MAKSMLKIMKTTSLLVVTGFGLILSGCLGLGNNIDEVVQRPMSNCCCSDNG